MDINQFQRAAGISDVLATRWFPHITAAMKEFGIDIPAPGDVYRAGRA
jgi:putative chitinase